jgi:hypothetical protein
MAAELRDRLDESLRAGQVDGLHAVAVVQSGQTLLGYYGSTAHWYRPAPVPTAASAEPGGAEALVGSGRR